MTENNSIKKNKVNVLKLPGIGFFMSFKFIFLVILDIFIFSIKGIKFFLIDIWRMLLRKKTKEKGSNKMTKEEKKRLKQEKYNNSLSGKRQNAKLEKMRLKLLDDLQKDTTERSKTPKVYWYRAKNKEGKIETGTINGYSKLDVNTFLVQESYIVYEIKNSKYSLWRCEFIWS